ncbi:MAG: PAS domain S-box protein [Negativicutes bacterium]
MCGGRGEKDSMPIDQELALKIALLEQENLELKLEITRRKESEEALQDKQAIYFALIQNSTDGIILRDDTGKITYANYAFAKMVQADEPSELLGYLHMEYVHPEDREECLYRLTSVTAGIQVPTWEHRLVGLQGKTSIVESTGVPISVSNRWFSMGVFHDITENRRATQLVREKDEILRTVIETIPDMIWLKNQEGVYLSCNRMFERFFGAREGDIVGKTDYDFVEATLADFFRENDRKAMTAGKSVINEEAVSLADDGRKMNLETIKTPMYAADGTLIGVLGVARDITGHKRMEEALRKSEVRFRQLVKTLPLPLAIINNKGLHTFINDKFVQVFGYDYDDLPTREKWRELAFPDQKYRVRVAETWAAAVDLATKTRQEVGPVEVDITCKSGEVRSVVVSGIVTSDEVLATFIDITDRRRHEQMMKASYERRRINDLMNKLIREGHSSNHTVYESARIMGANMMMPFSCFFIMIDEYQEKPRAYWQEHLNEYRLLTDSLMDALEGANRVSWESSEGIGVLCFEMDGNKITKETQKILAEELRDKIARKVPAVTVSIGIAEFSANMAEIRTYYRQAESAVGAGRKVWPQWKTYHYLDLGVFQLLSCFTDEAQITAYIDRTLGKLLTYDKKKDGAYLATLEIILMSDNLKDGAEKLSIHYQTMMFRKQRLETILGISFDDFQSRLALSTALQMLKLRKQ